MLLQICVGLRLAMMTDRPPDLRAKVFAMSGFSQ